MIRIVRVLYFGTRRRRNPYRTKRLLAERYEELRRQALGYADSCSPGLGLVLFTRQGMVSWMHAWPVRTSSPYEKPYATDSPRPPTAFDTRAEIAWVLASMVLSMRKGILQDRRSPSPESPLNIHISFFQPNPCRPPSVSGPQRNVLKMLFATHPGPTDSEWLQVLNAVFCVGKRKEKPQGIRAPDSKRDCRHCPSGVVPEACRFQAARWIRPQMLPNTSP